MDKYILTFINKPNFLQFNLVEFLSICEMNNIQNLKYTSDTFLYDPSKEPYLRINFNGIENKEICKKIIDRAILSKNIIKIISEGETIEEVIDKIKEEEIKEEMSSEKTFKYDFDIRNSKIKKETQEKILSQIHSKYPFKAKVDLKNPERIFIIFQSYTKDFKLKKTIFGKQIYGKNEEMRYYTKYDLIHRKYLGPTSTDHILSFLMSNLAQIKQYQNIIDPFVGTGSLLIPPSVFGANCFGCDLDVRVLKGYSVGYIRDDNDKTLFKHEGNIFSNFDDYNLIRPQIIRQDINHYSFRKNNFLFDSIICDPPYGWRACSKKTGLSNFKKEKRVKRLDKRKKEKEDNEINNNEKNSDEENDNYDYVYYGKEKRLFLPTSHCEVDTIFDSLIKFSKDCLKKNGILCCLFPVRKNYDEEELVNMPINFPQDKAFKLIYCCENKNSKLRSRWCLVYKKIE